MFLTTVTGNPGIETKPGSPQVTSDRWQVKDNSLRGCGEELNIEHKDVWKSSFPKHYVQGSVGWHAIAQAYLHSNAESSLDETSFYCFSLQV